ncbi:oligomeric complex COG6-domain-containing protein [Crucibulum laeve]|uniref:Conserved oligomeric Golgi complex subunit 6 n=1 Tax=Crucibulum laeve TaxID=68775 RepID=A0A5C3LII5_9AGAR|nr:oligomeric complex COG6-domain-containing protein [Crucibulum laeve]
MIPLSPTLPSSPSASSRPPLKSDRKSSYTSQTRNPVSLRLYKVLSTNFDDEATKEALRTLSELYASTVPTTKGKEVLKPIDDLDEDEFEVRERERVRTMTNAVESVPGESAARARKNLRRDMEKKLAEGSMQFLKALGEVDQKLVELQIHVGTMLTSCDEAEKQLALTTEASGSLLERAGSLREERQGIEDKKSIISLFLARFTLSEEEVEAMTSRDVPIGQRFFQAMDKTERIREDCRVLMAGEDGPSQAGLDIMASTSSNLEHGYEKILRWCSNEFRQIGRDIQLEVSHTMREAVARLRKRPELLTEALTILAETRQSTLQSSFITALTRGGPSGLPRPIELHAHDPMRYVGDMLAWVHQAIAAEREFLESLFGMKSDGRMVGSVRKFDRQEEVEEEEWIKELMDLAVGKLCVPLKLRVQQTVKSQESSIVAYKIANLLQFYLMTMRRTIGEHALLSTTLQEITDIAYKVFHESIEAQGRALLRIPLDLDDPSLTPPLSILEHTQVLRELMAVYQSSLLGDEAEEERDAGFQVVLDIMVDPAVEMCSVMSEEKKKVRPRWDRTIFVLNCLSYLESVLEPFTFTSAKQEMVRGVIEERVEVLTEEHYKDIMIDAGLAQVAETCMNPPTDEPLSRIPSTQPADLQKALRHFSSWLSGPEVVQSTRLAKLTAQRLHGKIHQAALGRMARMYGKICKEVRKPENRYEAASTLLGGERPFGQVNLLWQIFGLDEEDEDEESDEEEDDEDEEEDNEDEEEDGEDEEEDEDESADDEQSSERER